MSVAEPTSKPKMSQAELAAKTAIRETELPKVAKPLYSQDFGPTPQEGEMIREMYEWERRSAKVQFRMA